MSTLALAALAGCSRDLAIPARSTLAFEDQAPAVAPREARSFAVSGGARPYAFRFLGGAAGSGNDATLAAAPGGTAAAYQAGSTGLAVDVIEVIDAAHVVKELRVEVGPALAVAPSSLFLAPSGRASFAASGGKPPYVLEKVAAGDPGTIDGLDFAAAPSGGCGGPVSAPSSAPIRLLLRDATGAAPVPLQVSVGRGLDLFPAAGTGQVAPYEQIAFVASGGQPPYEYAMVTPVPSGGVVDPGRGTYQAGPVGDVVDHVEVTDASGEAQCFPVRVGPPLTVTLSTNDIRPGKAVRLEASGGRPPYAFAFDSKGNRSRGTLDPVTGSYAAGPNAGTTDLLSVSDATGAAPAVRLQLTVGPLQAGWLGGSAGCAAADVNGDGRADLVIRGGNLDGLAGAVTVPGSVPAVTSYAATAFAEPVVGDLDGDGRADLAWIDSTGDLVTMFGRASGLLVEGPRLAIGGRASGARLGLVPGTSRIFVPLGSALSACGVAGGGIVAVDWVRASASFGTPICVAGGRTISGLVAGDWNGDGIPDVAYLVTGTTDRIFVRLGTGAAFAAEVAVTVPAPWRLEIMSFSTVHQLQAVKPYAQATTDLAVVVVDAPVAGDFKTGLAAFTGGAAGLTLRQAGLFQFGGGLNVLGLGATGLGSGQQPRLAAWNGTDGATALFAWPLASNPPAFDRL